MTFHDLMLFYFCLALIWLCVGRFGEWCVYASVVFAFLAWLTGSGKWLHAINTVLLVFIFKSLIWFLFTPRVHHVYVVNDRVRD